MAFEWLTDFQKNQDKPDDYAEKTLAAYKLGMKAKGSIIGVRIVIDPNGCPASQTLDCESIFDPDNAPILPLDTCDRGKHCRCVYRPVMIYEIDQ